MDSLIKHDHRPCVARAAGPSEYSLMWRSWLALALGILFFGGTLAIWILWSWRTGDFMSWIATASYATAAAAVWVACVVLFRGAIRAALGRAR